ncbi:MAG TPA: hypothetical protein VNT75_00070 [Symbiobacteriaceae bacterium]|nr:hypothetical protein [Symbiobacteriaceae bacterium]
MKPTTHEMLQITELLRLESTDVQQMQAMLPMVADPELRTEISNCIQTGTTHVKALVAFCQSQQLA